MREVKSPSFEMTRTPTNIGVKVQMEDSEALERWVSLSFWDELLGFPLIVVQSAVSHVKNNLYCIQLHFLYVES